MLRLYNPYFHLSEKTWRFRYMELNEILKQVENIYSDHVWKSWNRAHPRF